MTVTRIPAPRVPLIDHRTGEIARVWYRFLQSNTADGETVDGSFSNTVKGTRVDFTTYNGISHVLCEGDPVIYLQAAAGREGTLTVTNQGTGTVRIRPASGENIIEETELIIDFQWSSVHLLPKSGGWVII